MYHTSTILPTIPPTTIMKFRRNPASTRTTCKQGFFASPTLCFVMGIVSFSVGYHAAKLEYSTQYLTGGTTSTANTASTAGGREKIDTSAPPPPPLPAAVAVAATTACSDYLTKGEELFYETAHAMEPPVTDKVTDHSYQIMYGKFLMPYYDHNPKMKMLEIGLGCNMVYGPGASVSVYKELFPKASLWEAEYDVECVDKHRDGLLKDIHVLTGDQGNTTVLDSWIEISGGNFDVIIDDGGHSNCQILHSFEKLWPTIKSGGLYFIEDLHVGKRTKFRKYTTDTCDENFIMFDKLKEYSDTLIYAGKRKEFDKSDIQFIFCQHQACVLGKK